MISPFQIICLTNGVSFIKNSLLINKLSCAASGNMLKCRRFFAHELFLNLFFCSKIKEYGAACYHQCKVLFPDKNIRFILSPYPYKNKLCIVISRFLSLDEFKLYCWFCFNLPYLWEFFNLFLSATTTYRT